MQKWIAKHIRELSKDGITFIPNAVTKKKCEYYIDRFEKIIIKFEKNHIPLNTVCQTIENCFRHDLKLINLIYHRKVDAILKKLIDKNYVLIKQEGRHMKDINLIAGPTILVMGILFSYIFNDTIYMNRIINIILNITVEYIRY